MKEICCHPKRIVKPFSAPPTVQCTDISCGSSYTIDPICTKCKYLNSYTIEDVADDKGILITETIPCKNGHFRFSSLSTHPGNSALCSGRPPAKHPA